MHKMKSHNLHGITCIYILRRKLTNHAYCLVTNWFQKNFEYGVDIYRQTTTLNEKYKVVSRKSHKGNTLKYVYNNYLEYNYFLTAVNE